MLFFIILYLKNEKAANEALENASKLAQEQLANCRAAVDKLLSDRNSQMNADYSELTQKIPLLLKEVETQRADEEEFLSETQEKLKKQIEDLKQAIAKERQV